jgi:cell filamentation protein
LTSLSLSHYRAVHHHLFQDVYVWAGKFRTVRISKNRSPFCYPENIEQEMHKLFVGLERKHVLRGQPRDEFVAQAAHFIAELNAIHPFREGNGRTQLTFITMVADHAGHPFDLAKIHAARFLAAMIESFLGNEDRLRNEIGRLVA